MRFVARCTVGRKDETSTMRFLVPCAVGRKDDGAVVLRIVGRKEEAGITTQSTS